MQLRVSNQKKKVLAVASSGGHWTQLRRVTPALTSYEVVYVTVLESYRAQVPDNKAYIVGDANRWHKLALIGLGFRIARIVAAERPDVVISTGAAPGYFAMLFGKLFGARTIWIDSITNIERLSLSGSLAGKYTDLWLTQWPHLAKAEGPHFGGSVL
jgi:UDP-N-acetylglucosamine:LPS N-acetylglucosamine transferase